MSLLFGAVNSDRVNCGHGSSLANITTGTLLWWCKPSNVTNSALNFFSKQGGPPSKGWEVFRRGVDGSSVRFLFYDSSAGNAIDVFSNTGAIVANAWNFFSQTWNVGGSSGKIYKGSLTALAADVTSSLSFSGVGAADDSAIDFLIGNGSSLAQALPESIATVQLFNRVLTLGEIQSQQFQPHVTSGCVAFYHLGYNGTSTQPDWSGHGNAGTVTGATVSAHVPLRRPFGRRQAWHSAMATAAPAGWGALLGQRRFRRVMT